MRRFWFSMALATVALLLVWNALFLFFPKGIFYFDNAMWKAAFDLIRTEPDSSEVLILGDSDAASSLKATSTKRKTLNLGLACAGPVEAEIVYDEYRRHHEPPKVVVIMMSDYYFYQVGCLPLYALSYDFFSLQQKNKIMSAFDKVQSQLELFGKNNRAIGLLPYGAQRRLYLGLLALHLTPQAFEYAQNLLTPEKWPPHGETVLKARQQRGHFVVGQQDSISRDRKDSFNFEDFHTVTPIVWALDRLISRAQRENAKVILKIDPLNRATAEKFSDRHRQHLSEFMKALKARHRGLIAEEAIPVLPDNYFGDEDIHTNARGADALSAELETQLDEIDPHK